MIVYIHNPHVCGIMYKVETQQMKKKKKNPSQHDRHNVQLRSEQQFSTVSSEDIKDLERVFCST